MHIMRKKNTGRRISAARAGRPPKPNHLLLCDVREG
jgi:hypothetical protein